MDFPVQPKEKYAFKTIFLVLDNAKYQHCNAVKKKVGELGITLLFLPPYSPNLNIIERLWIFTKKQILYAQYHDSPSKFHPAIKGFFDTINDTSHNNLNLHKLLSLNFQLPEQQNFSQNCAA
jgi:transposase